MRQNVCIALHDLVRGERPVVLRGSRIVVVQERDRLLRHPADEARREVVLVAQAPQLALHRLLQDALGGKVEGRAEALRAVDPVDQLLPVEVCREGREGG